MLWLILGFQMGRGETAVPQTQSRVLGEGLTWRLLHKFIKC